MRDESANNLQGRASLIFAMFVFGTIGIFVRYIPLPSSVIAMVRGIVGAVFLLVFVLVTKRRISWESIRRNIVVLFLSGAFIGINWILLFEAYRYTAVATATLCYYMAPIFVIIASPLLLKERLTPRKGVCVLAALAGMIMVSGVIDSGGGILNMRGILLGVGAASFYAGVILLNKKQRDISAYDSTIVQLAVAAAVLVPYTIATENYKEMEISPGTIILLGIVGVVHTGISYAMYFGSIQKLKAQTVALFSYIDPIVAVLASAVLLRERMSVYSVIGAVLILGAAFVCDMKE